MAKENYEIVESNDHLYQILIDDSKRLETPHGSVFQTPHKPIADLILEDLRLFGPESYTSGYSALSFAFTYDSWVCNDSVEQVREMLTTFNYEDDYWFNHASEGMPPARVLWNHLFVDDNRANDVRKWVQSLSGLQLAAVVVIYAVTDNINMAYLFGQIIDSGNNGKLTDLKNLYDNLLSSSIDSGQIERLFTLFRVFYTVERR
ncbi:MAG: hypothetical protein K2L05_07040 [Muribaculaceae bacterium]|nr:hypothetical protein [Muribaculaceae bacterium]